MNAGDDTLQPVPETESLSAKYNGGPPKGDPPFALALKTGVIFGLD